jgi:hypothetical protein
MASSLLARYTFRHGAVFDPQDRMARYVVRLSTALNDLRTASRYAVRRRQSSSERTYFVRLTASHLREIVFLIDADPTGPIPSLDEFLAALPPRLKSPKRAEIRRAHAQALRILRKPMAAGRPPVVNSRGNPRHPTLRDDLRTLRNGFFHYGHLESGDKALIAAMKALDGEAAEYVLREGDFRARYADDIAITLAHPYPLEFADDMHTRIVQFIGPVSTYIQMVEAAWFAAHRDDIVVRIPHEKPESLADFLGRLDL